MLTIQPCTNQMLELVDRDEHALGKIKVQDMQDNLVLGQFFPEPNFAPIQHLFLEYEDAVNQMVFSTLDELEEAIEALGLHLRKSGEEGKLDLYDVQIMNKTDISFKIKEPFEDVNEIWQDHVDEIS